MQEFRLATKAVISNARCLTEGVDVPAVDMGAFIAPRRSRVDIVQATGRAMRTAPSKMIGYVFLPLFLEMVTGESVEHAVARAEFEEVWTVLQALQEQDEVLADTIRAMREAEGSVGGFDDARFREKVQILGPAVSLAVLRESITSRCVERLAASWDYYFGKLFAFLRRFGHLNVPHAWPEDPQLAAWVIRQRQLRMEGRLAADRIQRLDSLGFDWTIRSTVPRSVSGEELYTRLVQFKERFGHCKVLRRWSEDPKLGHWAIWQRQLKKQGRLSEDRVQRLDALGFEWTLRSTVATRNSHMMLLSAAPRSASWEEMLARLVQFKDRFGHGNVPLGWSEDRQRAEWVSTQRQLRSQGDLSADHIRWLNDLGFEWEPRPGPRGEEG